MATNLTYGVQAVRHLRRRDPALRPILQKIGPFAMRLETGRFSALVSAIVAQQLSYKAADTIERRLRARVGSRRLTPAALLAVPERELRAAGLSRGKTAYLRDLAEKVHTGSL